MIIDNASITIKNENGAVLILVVISIVVLIGMTALAVDVSHLVVAKNELQNAADAGALRGARVLYTDDGLTINTGANQEAYNAAVANASENVAVEVEWTGGNSGDVQRGHWSFATRTFTPNASTALTNLWDASTVELDADTNFINAVQVTVRRSDIPVASIFARIFGFESFFMNAKAVAYRGYAGNFDPGEMDLPIAMCERALLINGIYSCTMGRMINSGGDITTSNTGGWTNFETGDTACTGGTNAAEMKNLVENLNGCGAGITFGEDDQMIMGEDMATNGGEIQSAFTRLYDCFHSKPTNQIPWSVKLPVVICDSNNVGPCEALNGVVELNIVWVSGGGEDPGYNDIPQEVGEWSVVDGPHTGAIGDVAYDFSACALDTLEKRQACWNSFTHFYKLSNLTEGVEGEPDIDDYGSAPYQKKAIYFLPDCDPHEPTGGSNGENYGVLAKYPVLVD